MLQVLNAASLLRVPISSSRVARRFMVFALFVSASVQFRWSSRHEVFKKVKVESKVKKVR